MHSKPSRKKKVTAKEWIVNTVLKEFEGVTDSFSFIITGEYRSCRNRFISYVHL